MTDARDSQLFVRSLDEPTPASQASQTAVRSIFNFPSEASRSSQVYLRSFDEATPTARSSQLFVRAIVRGRVADPSVKAWTYSLDGHDYYVLCLGDDETFVYDLYSEQWVDWNSPDRTNWRLIRGINWTGGTLNEPNYGSNVLAGDDTFGLLWFLDPTQPYDDSPDYLSEDQRLYFDRTVMGQIPMTGRSVVPCYVVHLTTDVGDPAYEGASVTLSTSDDLGNTFNDHDAIVVTTDQYITPELTWYSLGQIKAPGRLFKVTDDGAVARIDQMDMNDDAG